MKNGSGARGLRVALIAAAVLLCGLGYALWILRTGWGIPCLWHSLTGLSCAGCGLSRACMALLRGDLLAAFSYNALWPLFFAYALWYALSVAVPYIRTGGCRALPRPWWVHAMVACILMAWGILRNVL